MGDLFSDASMSSNATSSSSSSSSDSTCATLTTTPFLPASVRTDTNTILVAGGRCGASSPRALLSHDLCVRRLNDVHPWLWLAGLPVPPQALHVQRMKGRDIVVCEQADLHLVWEPKRIFVKPLPRCLLDAAFWRQHLCASEHGELASLEAVITGGSGEFAVPAINVDDIRQADVTSADKLWLEASAVAASISTAAAAAASPTAATMAEELSLYGCALGFLLSYVALVAHESDYRIAMELGLLPDDLKWPHWVALVDEIGSTCHCLEHQRPTPIPTGGANVTPTALPSAYSPDSRRSTSPLQLPPLPPPVVNQRYIYGELRLSRLNQIYYVTRGALLRGYIGSAGGGRSRSISSGGFLRRRAKSLITLFAYVTIVLAAMQVALTTAYARDNRALQRAAYLFALSCIVAPIFFLAATAAVLLALMAYYTFGALVFRRRRLAALRTAWDGADAV